MKKLKIIFPIAGFILIVAVFVLGFIITMINSDIGIYVILFGFLLMYIAVCILILRLLFKTSKKSVLIIIIITVCIIGVGTIVGYKGIDEQKDTAIALDVDSSKVTIEYQNDIRIRVKKPIFKRIDKGEKIDIYYDKDNIDSIRLISYSNIGNRLFLLGIMFLFVGGIIAIVIIGVSKNKLNLSRNGIINYVNKEISKREEKKNHE